MNRFDQPRATLQKTAIFMFCSQGRPWYLSRILKQIRKYNSQIPIIFFGNPQTVNLGFGITHILWQEYKASYAEFIAHYIHASINSYEFETACFERWFMIRDYMKEQGIESCWQLDTDILVFSDLEAEAARLQEYDFTLSQLLSGHCSFWRQRKCIGDFSDFIISFYKDGDSDSLREQFEKAATADKAKTSISDMTLLRLFAASSGAKIFDSARCVDASIYDHVLCDGINSPEDEAYEASHGCKNIYWRDALPYARTEKGKEYVRLKTIHCQGKAKKYIRLIVEGNKITGLSLLYVTICDLFRRAGYFFRKMS